MDDFSLSIDISKQQCGVEATIIDHCSDAMARPTGLCIMMKKPDLSFGKLKTDLAVWRDEFEAACQNDQNITLTPRQSAMLVMILNRVDDNL